MSCPREIAPAFETGGVLLQLAHDSLAIVGRAAGHIIRFCKVQARPTDNAMERNSHADKLANNGRLMDLSEYIMLATAAQSQAPADAWEDKWTHCQPTWHP